MVNSEFSGFLKVLQKKNLCMLVSQELPVRVKEVPMSSKTNGHGETRTHNPRVYSARRRLLAGY